MGEGENTESQEVIPDGPKESAREEETAPIEDNVEEENIEDVGAMSTDDEEFEILKRKPGRPGRKPGSSKVSWRRHWRCTVCELFIKLWDLSWCKNLGADVIVFPEQRGH